MRAVSNSNQQNFDCRHADSREQEVLYARACEAPHFFLSIREKCEFPFKDWPNDQLKPRQRRRKAIKLSRAFSKQSNIINSNLSELSTVPINISHVISRRVVYSCTANASDLPSEEIEWPISTQQKSKLHTRVKPTKFRQEPLFAAEQPSGKSCPASQAHVPCIRGVVTGVPRTTINSFTEEVCPQCKLESPENVWQQRRRTLPRIEDSTNLTATTVNNDATWQRHCGIAFFDLDDTLIPTEWVRRAFVLVRQQQNDQRSTESAISMPPMLKRLWAGVASTSMSDSPRRSKGQSISVEEATSPTMQAAVRAELERLGGADFDERAAHIVEHACSIFGVAVIVTNARSAAWLQIASDLFPRFKAQLRRFSVPIIRAASGGCKTIFINPLEYFQYWTDLKKAQFQKVIVSTVNILIALGYKVNAPPHVSTAMPTGPIPAGEIFAVGSYEEACDSLHVTPLRSQIEELNVEAHEKLDETLAFQTLLKSQPKYLRAILMSPRSHSRESKEVESLLRQFDSWLVSLDADALTRILAHQVRRFFLCQHSMSNPSIARLPYRPEYLLPRRRMSFDLRSNSSDSRFTAFEAAPLRRRLPAYSNLMGGYTLDIICVGDSEFELCAARELSTMYPSIFDGCGLIKCKPGLPPGLFRQQLEDIERAINFIYAASGDTEIAATGLTRFGTTVLAEYTSRACRFETRCIGLSLNRRNERLLTQLALLTTPMPNTATQPEGRNSELESLGRRIDVSAFLWGGARQDQSFRYNQGAEIGVINSAQPVSEVREVLPK